MRGIFCFSFLGLALAMAGCATHDNFPQPPPNAPAPAASAANDKRITTNPSFDAVARVLSVSESPGLEGFLKVEFQIQNTTQSVQSVGYRINWTDRNGAPVDIASPVPPMTLMPGETAPVVALAPSPVATDFRASFFRVNR